MSASPVYSVSSVLTPFTSVPEKRRANSGFTCAGRSRASTNAFHCFGVAANSYLSARTCSACKQALSRMKSVTLTPEVSAPVRMSFSWWFVARRLMRRVRIVLIREMAIACPRFQIVRTLYVTKLCPSTPRSLTAILEAVQARRIVDENLFADRRVGRPDRELVQQAAIVDGKRRHRVGRLAAGKRGRGMRPVGAP